MRVIYAGTPDFAVPALQALLASSHEVVAVYTQPDRPAGRGKKLRASPVKQVAQEAGIPVFQPKTLRDEDAQAELTALNADLMVVAAYGLILPIEVLNAPRLGCINIHASLLPRWRGAAPIQRAIVAGDAETGITMMQMAEGLDTGDILLQRSVAIASDETGSSLHDKLAALGAPCLMETMLQMEQGALKPIPQNDALANYAHKLEKSESAIDWHETAEAIDRKVRGFNAWPVAQTNCSLGVLRIWASVVDTDISTSEDCGKVLKEDKKRGVLLQTGAGGLWLTTLQLPGKKPLAASDFLNGRSLLGETLN